jgi:hypothetical protein
VRAFFDIGVADAYGAQFSVDEENTLDPPPLETAAERAVLFFEGRGVLSMPWEASVALSSTRTDLPMAGRLYIKLLCGAGT